MTAWVVLASFVGAVIGATIPALVSLRGQHPQARTEWSQRLDRAIAAVTSGDTTAREIGKELLADLIDSNLGSEEDRDLAYLVAGIDLAAGQVDGAASTGDNETHGQEDQT